MRIRCLDNQMGNGTRGVGILLGYQSNHDCVTTVEGA